VAYVTDNGWITDPQSGRYAPRSKQSPYDGGLRTPILLHWPGRIQPRKDDHAISSLDLMPTLLKLTGTANPPGLGGLDLLDRDAIANRRGVFGACFMHDAIDLDRPSSSLKWRWMIQGNWKLIVPNPPLEPNGALELYELHQDPGEFLNRAPFETERVARLREDLDRWWPGN
jgi:arylsulfatase A-like enzyme